MTPAIGTESDVSDYLDTRKWIDQGRVNVLPLGETVAPSVCDNRGSCHHCHTGSGLPNRHHASHEDTVLTCDDRLPRVTAN